MAKQAGPTRFISRLIGFQFRKRYINQAELPPMPPCHKAIGLSQNINQNGILSLTIG